MAAQYAAAGRGAGESVEKALQIVQAAKDKGLQEDCSDGSPLLVEVVGVVETRPALVTGY